MHTHKEGGREEGEEKRASKTALAFVRPSALTQSRPKTLLRRNKRRVAGRPVGETSKDVLELNAAEKEVVAKTGWLFLKS